MAFLKMHVLRPSWTHHCECEGDNSIFVTRSCCRHSPLDGIATACEALSRNWWKRIGGEQQIDWHLAVLSVFTGPLPKEGASWRRHWRGGCNNYSAFQALDATGGVKDAFPTPLSQSVSYPHISTEPAWSAARPDSLNACLDNWQWQEPQRNGNGRKGMSGIHRSKTSFASNSKFYHKENGYESNDLQNKFVFWLSTQRTVRAWHKRWGWSSGRIIGWRLNEFRRNCKSSGIEEKFL